MTQQDTLAPAVPTELEKARTDIRDLIAELKAAVDRLVKEIEDADLCFDLDESNPKLAPLMQRVQEDIEQAVINIESAHDAVFFEW
jgi:hypothetical protein